MPRPPRITEAGFAYHVLNRRVMRLPLFRKPEDYLAFEDLLKLALARDDAPRLLGWCFMPNHWHLVLLAVPATNLSSWMQWLSVTHTHRWHQHYHRAGQGPLYQGRFKSFPIQSDGHLLAVLRYVEANASRARLVERAQDWRWGSLRARVRSTASHADMLAELPVDLPANWTRLVNGEPEAAQLKTIRQCLVRGSPYGDERWRKKTASTLSLATTLRARGRPRNAQPHA